jgi:hypothetical protein
MLPAPTTRRGMPTPSSEVLPARTT